jgi:iron complex outermembrane receptor protein
MKSLVRGAAALATLCLAPAQAQTPPVHSDHPAPEVVVTGNPLGSSLFDMATPTSVLDGTELRLKGQSSLGETLRDTPGVSSTYFGPGASRPIIRGLDGDRIRILQGSVGTLDASGLSYDHAVPIDPLAVSRVEVVRGAAALMYGGSAVGGVVNVLTNRVPDMPKEGVDGAFEMRAGGAELERAGSVVLDAGNGRFALHADGFWRAASDLRIPGFARSARQRADDAINNPTLPQPYGIVPNTGGRTNGGSLGGSMTFDRGYLGMSYTNHSSNYGSPLETNVRIDLHSDRYDLAGELRDLAGPFRAIKVKAAYTDYVHREIDGGVVGTNFLNKGFEGHLEATHKPLGRLTGVLGFTAGNARFSALGDEAFVPNTRTRTQALYVYEELPIDALKFTFGARVESSRIDSAGDQAIQNLADPANPVPRFAASDSKRFRGTSASFGTVYNIDGRWALSGNLARTERAPTFYELFSNGPHVATGAFEVGNANLGLEKSTAFDAGLKWREGPHSASLSAFTTRFSNYIFLGGTGNRRSGDGAFEDAVNPGTSTSGETELLGEATFRAVPARFTGLEAQTHIHLMERPGALFLELKGDLVRATNLLTGEGLPRIPPRRLGVALGYAQSGYSVRLEVNHSAAQNRVPAGEATTAAYTLVNVYATYRTRIAGKSVTAWLRATNLTDREARLATSFLREIVPLGGRALSGGVRLEF